MQQTLHHFLIISIIAWQFPSKQLWIGHNDLRTYHLQFQEIEILLPIKWPLNCFKTIIAMCYCGLCHHTKTHNNIRASSRSMSIQNKMFRILSAVTITKKMRQNVRENWNEFSMKAIAKIHIITKHASGSRRVWHPNGSEATKHETNPSKTQSEPIWQFKNEGNSIWIHVFIENKMCSYTFSVYSACDRK